VDLDSEVGQCSSDSADFGLAIGKGSSLSDFFLFPVDLFHQDKEDLRCGMAWNTHLSFLLGIWVLSVSGFRVGCEGLLTHRG